MSVNKSNINILYWNCQRKDSEYSFQKIFFQLLKEKEIDIFCLDEAGSKKDEFINNINNSSLGYIFVEEGDLNGAHGRLRVFSKQAGLLQPKNKSQRYVNLNFMNRFDLCFVHFRSLVMTDPYDKLKDDEKTINGIYGFTSYEKKFLVGDFNAMPYSTTMLDSRFLNTIRCGEECFDIKRINLNNHRRINPSWTAYSENAEGVYGTLPRKASTLNNIGLQLFDQVVFDEDLQTFYVSNSFEIISNVKGKRLLKDDFTSDYSDHLPIMFSLDNL